METSIQNGTMAAGYAFLFILLFRSRLRRHLVIMLIGCAFATVYNIAYDTAIHFRVIVSLALIFRLLVPVEAVWKCLGSRTDIKTAVTVLVTTMTLRAFSPQSMTAGYITVRLAVTITVTLLCFAVGVANYLEKFETSVIWNRHLMLQAAWMSLHTLFTWGAFWYNANWARRSVARWLYIGLSLGLVWLYKEYLLTEANPLVHPVDPI